MNSVIITGRLTKDAAVRTTQSGKDVLNFSIAHNESHKVEDGYETITSFFDCNYWSDYAAKLKPKMLKGQMVLIEGRLRQDRWEHDGKNYSKIEILVSKIELLATPAKQDDSVADEDIPF